MMKSFPERYANLLLDDLEYGLPEVQNNPHL
jgi:hypothetical protein